MFLVLRRADGPHLPFSEILRRIEIAFRVASLRAVKGIGSPGIQPVRQRFFGALHQLRHAFLSFFVAAQFIPQRQHHKGRVLSEHVQYFRQFFPVISERHIAFKSVRRIPVGKLRLHQHPDPICCREGRFRRAVGMKPHAVHAVGLIAPQNLFPFPFRHGRMPRFRPGGAVGLAPQEDPPPVQAKAVFTVRKKGPEAGKKGCFVRFARMAVRLQSNPDGIELRIFHLPFSNIFRQRNPRNTDCPDTAGYSFRMFPHTPCQRVAFHPDRHAAFCCTFRCADFRLKTHTASVRVHHHPRVQQKNGRLCFQPDVSDQSVPVGLCFVRSRRGIQNRLCRPFRIAVVAGKADLVFSRPQRFRFKHPGSRQRSRKERPRLLPVHRQQQLPASFDANDAAPALRRSFPKNLACKACRPGIGHFPGEPGSDALRSVFFGERRRRRLPEFFRAVRNPDAVFVQRAGKLSLRFQTVLKPYLPFSGKIHSNLLSRVLEALPYCL